MVTGNLMIRTRNFCCVGLSGQNHIAYVTGRGFASHCAKNHMKTLFFVLVRMQHGLVHKQSWCKEILTGELINRLIDLEVRVFANGLGNWGSSPSRLIPKT